MGNKKCFLKKGNRTISMRRRAQEREEVNAGTGIQRPHWGISQNLKQLSRSEELNSHPAQGGKERHKLELQNTEGTERGNNLLKWEEGRKLDSMNF
jgi:hypothetical protein